MNALTFLSLAALLVVCVWSSITDIRTERVSNRVLAVSFVMAIVLNAIQCGFMLPNLRIPFVVNACVTSAVALVLYFTHTWAGGDCKLACVLAFLYPPAMHASISGTIFTLPLAVGLAFVFGSIYLLIFTLIRIAKKERSFSLEDVGKPFLAFAQAYVCALLLIGSIHLVCGLIVTPYYSVSPVLMTAFGFCIIWLFASKGLLRNKVLLVSLLILNVVLSLVSGGASLGLNPARCIFVFAVMLLRIIVAQQNYEQISTSEVAEGMILSTASSLMLVGSRVKGLPGVSTEDLRSRLTEEEANSVRRWGESAKGSSVITVVKKMPFAVFVSLGFVAYIALWKVF